MKKVSRYRYTAALQLQQHLRSLAISSIYSLQEVLQECLILGSCRFTVRCRSIYSTLASCCVKSLLLLFSTIATVELVYVGTQRGSLSEAA